jgi:hypothetical protein
MTKNLRKLILAMLCGLLTLEPGVVLGQGQAASELTPFDRYGRIPWDKERDHLDRFAGELINHRGMTGYIYIQEAQISGAGYAVGHAIDIAKYLITVHHIPWNRVAWRDLGFGNEFVTTLWLFPSGQPPLYSPEYKPPTDITFIEDAPRPVRKRRRH